MNKNSIMTAFAIMLSFASFAVAPITGSSIVCVGSTTTLTDGTPGGTWSSSNTGVAMIGSGGTISAISPGAVTIFYIVGLDSVNLSFSVNAAPASISGGSTVCTGSSISLTDAATGGSWFSGNTTMATVSSAGIVTGETAGVVNIYYTMGSTSAGCLAEHLVTVTTAPAISGSSTICTGSAITLTASPAGGSWSVGGSSIATVGSSGVVTGLSSGVTNIYYYNGGCYAYHTVTVNAAAAISGASTVCTGSSVTLTGTPSGGIWISGNTTMATVSSAGVVSGESAGVVNIYYTMGSTSTTCIAEHLVTVTTAPAISGSSTICTGSAITLTASPAGGSWSVGGSAIASVSSTGVVTGLSAGVTNIYYYNGGCYAYHTVTVNAAATISGASTVCTGSSVTLTGTPSGGIWISGNTTMATVSTSGVVTGESAGIVNIYYTMGSTSTTCIAEHLVTVTTAPAISGSSTICTGSAITLTASPAGGSWSVGGSAIASVSSTGVVTGLSAGVTNIYYYNGGCYAYHTVTVNAAATISGASTVCAGSSVTLTGTPAGGTWISGNTTMATVSSAGVVTGESAGIVNIYYTMGSTSTGCIAEHLVTVSVPPSISGPSTICTGSAITLTASPAGGSWSVGVSGIATVSSGGLVTGLSAGVTNIYYVHYGCGAYHTVTVNAAPANIAGDATVCIGSTIALTDATAGGSWISGNTSLATVSSIGVVTGVSAGTLNIYYTMGGSLSGCTAYHTVTVNAAASISGPSAVCTGSTIALTGTPTGGTWAVGGSSIATVSSTGVVTSLSAGITNIYYSAGGCYAYHYVTVNAAATISGASTLCTGTTITLTSTPTGGTWSSGGSGIATVTSAGIVTGLSAGVTNIYYFVGGCYAYHTVTVNAAPATIAGDATVCIGSTITLSDATAGGSWISGNTSLATVSSIGVVTGVSAGTLNIYYTMGGSLSSCTSYHTVTVNAAASISGPSAVCTGSTIALTGTPTGGTWAVGGSSIATVSSTGVVTSLSAGITNIYYSAGGCYAYHYVTVNAAATISGASILCTGTTITLTSTPAGGTWSSGGSGIATVTSAGIVTGLSAGVANIYYFSGGCYAYHTVTVNAAPATIAGDATVCIGSTIALTDAAAGGSWISGNTSLATVSSIGVVTGVSAGTLNIYYTMGGSLSGCTAYHTVTVNAAASISGPSAVCTGSTIALTGTPTGGTWAGGGSSIATVTTSGVVTGLSAGVTNIYYSAGGCYAYHTVTVNAAASISGASTVCTGTTITLTGTPPGGTWISGNTTMATISSAGVLTGETAGVVNIYYTMGSTSTGCLAEHLVTVRTAPAISGSSTICDGTAITLTASPAGGSWSAGDTGIAIVSSSGVVTSLSTGVTNIYYYSGGCYAYRMVTVNAAASITGASAVCTGSTITLTGIPAGGTWISGNTTMATVSSAGVVSGESAGVVNIYYTLGSTSTTCIAEHLVTVSVPPTISGPSVICTGSAITLTGSPVGGSWSGGGSGIATVSSDGLVTGLSAGITNIYYIHYGCGAYHTVTVNAAPAAISGSSSVGVDSTITLGDAVAGGAWITGNSAIATVDASGAVTGVAIGDVNIYYTMGSTISGCTVYHTVTVDLAPAAVPGAGSGAVPEPGATAAVKPIFTTDGINVYPNPTSGNLHIDWAQRASGLATIAISDMVGHKVYNATMAIDVVSRQAQIDLSGLKDGVYLISINCGNIFYSNKLVIQK